MPAMQRDRPFSAPHALLRPPQFKLPREGISGAKMQQPAMSDSRIRQEVDAFARVGVVRLEERAGVAKELALVELLVGGGERGEEGESKKGKRVKGSRDHGGRRLGRSRRAGGRVL